MKKFLLILLTLLMVGGSVSGTTGQNVLRPHQRWWWWCFNFQMTSGEPAQICGRTRELCESARGGMSRDNPNSHPTACQHIFQ